MAKDRRDGQGREARERRVDKVGKKLARSLRTDRKRAKNKRALVEAEQHMREHYGR